MTMLARMSTTTMTTPKPLQPRATPRRLPPPLWGRDGVGARVATVQGAPHA
jgi:hypothetical protein